MKFFFLDAGGAFLLPSIIVAFMIATVFVEAIVMLLFKLNKFGKCLLDSLIVNIASLIVGFILISFAGRIDFREGGSGILSLVFLFVATAVVEALLLMLLNKKLSRPRIWLASTVMNIFSYGLLFFFSGL